jgi:hypothetical protein
LNDLDLTSITKRTPLYLLHITASHAHIYRFGAKGTQLVGSFTSSDQAAELTKLAAQTPEIAWALLVDQSEEIFWGDVMLVLRGAARKAWIQRLFVQSKIESPYRWSQVQGKSRVEPEKLYVLGYALGRTDAIKPWLDALQVCDAPIRGMYAPVMLTAQVLRALKIKLPKNLDGISVLVTPCTGGLRQTVLEGGRIRFSRLALNPKAKGSSWFDAVYKEVAKLREYLISSQLLKNDYTGMHLYVVQPLDTVEQATTSSPAQHTQDRYHWLHDPHPTLVYLKALAKSQPWHQLAPNLYRKRDQSIQASRALHALSFLISAAAVLFISITGSQLWQIRSDTQLATQATRIATEQYQTVAKTFPQSPLTAAQLLAMRQRWEDIKAITPPQMEGLLMVAGQTLERHLAIAVDEMHWVADNEKNSTGFDGMDASAATPIIPIPETINAAMGAAGSGAKPKKEITALLLKGSIRGIASDDLRGTRDTLTKLEADFNRQPKIRAEITKRPLDLSTQSSFSGSSTQDKSELNFEIKLWQR